ncbi:hypothetical protein, partial [Vibrio cholerae]|uniref:hypothetical protein n=1 Tax=Vibrio cholerae TaxID=666 RepID=UPI001125065A
TIWLGRDDNQPTKLTGASGALRVYAQYLKYRIPEKLQLPWPEGITTFDDAGIMLDAEFSEGLIHSHARLTYNQVNETILKPNQWSHS